MGQHQDFMKLTKERKEVLAKDSAKVMGLFDQMRDSVCCEGTMSFKNKQLVAVGIAINTHCIQCISHHIKVAIEQGASREEIIEVIEIAILMGGGPSRNYGAIALEVFDELISSQESN